MASDAPHCRRLALLRSHTAVGSKDRRNNAVAGSGGRVDSFVAPSWVGLTEIERYWFETQGFVVIPGVLSRQQVQACHDAFEQNRDLVNYTPLSEDGRGWVVPPSL